MSSLTLYIDNSSIMRLEGLENHLGVPITDATVSVQLETLAGVAVGSPIPLESVGSGDYEGAVDADLDLTDRAKYEGKIVAESGGLKYAATADVTARERKAA